MLQQEVAEDFVIATGQQTTVRDFVNKSAAELGITLEWSGSGVDEQGTIVAIQSSQQLKVKLGDVIVKIDPAYYRPAEVESLLGDPSYAKEKLGWSPSITLDEMIAEMMAHDFNEARKNTLLSSEDYITPTPIDS
jgi:GDPmannose 4,6-dehydratase